MHRIGGKMWVVGSIETMVRKLIGLQKGGTNAVGEWPPRSRLLALQVDEYTNFAITCKTLRPKYPCLHDTTTVDP